MDDYDEIIFSPNKAIDASIKEMLPSFDVGSQKRMCRAILKAKKAAENHSDENTDAGARHIFREFIPAYKFNLTGFNFEYEKQIQDKTPDWIDFSTKHMMESYTFERGGSSPFLDRITAAVDEKCKKYKEIIDEESLSFMVAVYLDFLTGMTLEECREQSKSFRPVFEDNKALWAILFFTETHVRGISNSMDFIALQEIHLSKVFRVGQFQQFALMNCEDGSHKIFCAIGDI